VSEAIKALIAAAEAFAESHQGCTCWSRDDYAELALFRDAIAAAKAAAEARPEPKPDSAARDWPEDFADENGNYSVLCSICQQWFLGYKRRVACKVCATKEARPEPAAEPSDPRERRGMGPLEDIRLARECATLHPADAIHLLCSAAEKILAREVRRG
jgi:hypothetical protein